jgi:hypothetical protein
VKPLNFGTSVFKLHSESDRGLLMTRSKKSQIKGVSRKNLEVKCSDLIRRSSCREIQEFYVRDQSLTLNSILIATKEDLVLPDFKKSTLQVLLRKIAFEYAQEA